MAVMIKCPECKGKFSWNIEADGWPDECPFKGCGFVMAHNRADDDVVMPFIRSAATKATDKVYRDMEAGSEVRAQAAADLAGVPVSEMSGLKITNLNDRKDAEVAAMPVNNPVSQFMQANPQAAGFRGGDGLGYSAAVGTGPAPNVGAKMRTVVQNAHAELSRGTAVSDRPALETQNPLYRRRG